MLYTRAQNIAKKFPLLLLFGAYSIIAFCFYVKSYNSLLIDDGIAGLVDFEKQGYSGFFNSFNFPSLYYMHDLAMLLIYGIAGKSSFAWFLFMLGMHCLCATLAFRLFRLLYTLFGIAHASYIAIAGSVLFLLSPYQTENILWAATIHYGIALLVLLSTSIYIINSLTSHTFQGKQIAIILFLHVAALSSLEIALVFPAVYFFTGAAVIYSGKTQISLLRFSATLLVPLIILSIAYFALTYLLKGMIIPHYGNDHLQNLSFANYIVTTAKHTVKLVTYTHFANYHWREIVYTFCERWKVISVILFIVLIIAGAIAYAAAKKNGLALFLLLVLCGGIVLFPVLNMYFMYLFTPENDRLTYFFSLFLYQIIALLAISVSMRWGAALLCIYACIGLVLLTMQVSKWHEAGKVHSSLLHSFAWSNSPQVYVLNQPSNYKGVYEFRTNRRLSRALYFFNGIDMEDRITHILSSAQVSMHDYTNVQIINDTTLQVDFITNGGWLMNNQVGASDYSTNVYSVTVDPWKPSYKVVFHNKPKGAVYVYATGNAFKKLEGF